MRSGRFSSVTGIHYDIAVRNNAGAAAAIVRAFLEYMEPDGNIHSISQK